jgi:hypothetical protein
MVAGEQSYGVTKPSPCDEFLNLWDETVAATRERTAKRQRQLQAQIEERGDVPSAPAIQPEAGSEEEEERDGDEG